VAGSTIVESLIISGTESPPAGAGPSSVSAALMDVPPVTFVGVTVIAVAPGGLTKKVAAADGPRFCPTENCTEVVVATGMAVMVNRAEMSPVLKETLGGMDAAAGAPFRMSNTMGAAAGSLRLTAALNVLPPFTLVALSARTRKYRGGGPILSHAVVPHADAPGGILRASINPANANRRG
jgi:hypothetical protein